METGSSSASAPTSESVGVDTSVNLSTRSFRKKEGANWDVIVNWYHLEMVRNPSALVEHEATTSKIGEDQLFYFQQRGIDHEKAVAAMISGFCRDVFNELPLEFAAEVNQLMSLKLEGSVG